MNINLFINYNNKIFQINSFIFSSIYSLKYQIYQKFKISINKQQIYYINKILDNNKSLYYYSINNNSTLYLETKSLKGGKINKSFFLQI